MTWKNQIKSATEKACRAIGFLKYAKHFLPKAILKALYTSIVEPHCQYCCFAWGCCNSTDIIQLQRLQNRTVRIATNSHFDAPNKPLIQSLGWKAIEELINRQVNLPVFKCLNSIAPKCICDIFTKNTVNATRSLRTKNTDLRLLLNSSANGQTCFSFEVRNIGMAFQLWPNKLLKLKPLSA